MLDDYQDLIDELLGTPAIFRDLLARGAASPEVRALVAASLDRDRVVLDRLQRMTRETAPHLRALPDAAAIPPHGDEPPADAALLAGFETARGDLVSLLMNLTIKDWSRTATHDDGGFVSLADEVERHVEFDEAQLSRVQAALGAPD